MVFIVQTRTPIGQQIWSWVVVGAVVVLVLGTGATFTTSGHPWIADGFYAFGALLVVVKFFTWEDVRQQEPTRRRRANSLATVSTGIILSLIIAGNHYLNPRAKGVAPNPVSQGNRTPQGQTASETSSKLPGPESRIADSNVKSKQPAAKNRPKQRPSESSPIPRDSTEETNETRDDVHVKAQHHAPKDEVTAKVNRARQDPVSGTGTTSPITINNAPGGIAISGGNVSNPTVNNFGSVPRMIGPGLREVLGVSLAKHPATVRVYAVNDMEANEFAQQLYDLLTTAGWKMKDNQIILVQLERPWRGVRVGYHGEPPLDEKGLVSVPDNTPQAALVGALLTAKIEGVSVNPKMDLEEGFIELLVSSNPHLN
jgi:hypothetical protein